MPTSLAFLVRARVETGCVPQDVRYSRREVSRAGDYLARRLREQRRGKRDTIIDPDDAAAVRARDVVEWWRSQHVEPMLAVYETVQRLAPRLDLQQRQQVAVSFRPKRFDSTIEKLTREPGKLADMVDIGGVRAVVNRQAEVDELHRQLDDEVEVRRVRDWARNPRATGYRAVHLHVRESGRMIEVQLRTLGQDAWANVVEEESRLSGVNYKAGEGNPTVLEFFRVVADFFGTIELGEEHPNLGEQFFEAYQRARPHLRMPRLRDIEP
jgi:putative GTP pyrophosphokinase